MFEISQTSIMAPKSMMMNYAILLFLLLSCGCASLNQSKYFPQDLLYLSTERWLESVLKDLDEPPLWSPNNDHLSSLHHEYRITILTSSRFAVCMTLERTQSYDVVLRTKVLTWEFKEPINIEKPEIISKRVVFRDCRVLPKTDWEQFGYDYDSLAICAPTNYPPIYSRLFSKLDGTGYFLESYNHSEYRMIHIDDPSMQKLSKEERDNLKVIIPDIDVENIELFNCLYIKILKFFADKTPLEVFDEFRSDENNIRP